MKRSVKKQRRSGAGMPVVRGPFDLGGVPLAGKIHQMNSARRGSGGRLGRAMRTAGSKSPARVDALQPTAKASARAEKRRVMGFHPRTILWPTDFSPRSIKGAQCARAMCEAFDARLHVMHIAPILVWSSPALPIVSGADMLVSTDDVVAPAKEALRELIAKQFPKLAKITTHVTSGNAWYEICLYAEQNKIDMIVMATHGLTGAKRLFLGSTAERVVRHASCPVLTVKSFAGVFARDADQEQSGGKPIGRAATKAGRSRSLERR
jgi:nucleotide-binding universal stress UspA family protein